MQRSPAHKRSTVITPNAESHVNSFAEDVDKGLSSSPKYLPCIYFYDYTGSLLFEEICRLPEYYPTRTETEILKTYSKNIVACLPPDCLLVELGCGSCAKTRYVIEEMLKRRNRVTYSPIDVSRRMLKESALSLVERYDRLEIVSVAAEYEEGLRHIKMRGRQPKLILWLGSSIGNFELEGAVAFLKNVWRSLAPEDLFLIGFDLKKDRSVLEKAYNDSRGVTAQFNLNLLRRINRELGGEFDLDLFAHRAIFNEARSRIEMYLVSTCRQQVHVADMDRTYHFGRDETIHTENSRKFSWENIEALTDRAGMRIVGRWFDRREYFSLVLCGTAQR